jgi:hypothetical protein
MEQKETRISTGFGVEGHCVPRNRESLEKKVRQVITGIDWVAVSKCWIADICLQDDGCWVRSKDVSTWKRY